MLDSYIIDSIQREERERADQGRARLHLPLHAPAAEDRAPDREDPDSERGVLIIPLDPSTPLSEDDAA